MVTWPFFNAEQSRAPWLTCHEKNRHANPNGMRRSLLADYVNVSLCEEHLDDGLVALLRCLTKRWLFAEIDLHDRVEAKR